MFHTRFLSPTDQKCVESSRIDKSSIIAHPVNSDGLHTWERSLKCHTHTCYMTLLIIDMDFLYQIDCTTFHSFLSWNIRKDFFFNFQKLAGLWMCDWLAKWIIMLRFMDLGWPRIFRRSNVGLVTFGRDNLFPLHVLYGVAEMWYTLDCTCVDIQ